MNVHQALSSEKLFPSSDISAIVILKLELHDCSLITYDTSKLIYLQHMSHLVSL